jgi:hypothetical protein
MNSVFPAVAKNYGRFLQKATEAHAKEFKIHSNPIQPDSFFLLKWALRIWAASDFLVGYPHGENSVKRMGQKAPKGPASHPLGIETGVGRQKSAALIFLILFSSRKKECLAASKNKVDKEEET